MISNRPYQIAVCFLITMLTANLVSSDEVDIGALIARCSECHTEDGLAGIPGWPSIARTDKNSMIGKLQGHRAGLVNDSTLKKVARDLMDIETEAVARHFSTLLPNEE